MKTIEDHIQKDKEILADPTITEPMRHHIEDELHDLEEYVEHLKAEIEAGDHIIKRTGSILRCPPRRTSV